MWFICLLGCLCQIGNISKHLQLRFCSVDVIAALQGLLFKSRLIRPGLGKRVSHCRSAAWREISVWKRPALGKEANVGVLVSQERRVGKKSRSEGRLNLRGTLSLMSLGPHVRRLATSVCRVKFWSHQEMCLFRNRRSSELGELAGEEGETVWGKQKKKTRHRMRNSKRGAVPVISQLLSSRVIVAWGWMTNKFRKWSQVWAARNEVWINLSPQTIVGLMSAAVDLAPVGISWGVCLGFSWHYTGRVWQKLCFLRSVFCVCRLQTQANSEKPRPK